MGYSVKILKDSVGPEFTRNGFSDLFVPPPPTRKRITTFELTYPRMVHAELMTHRLFSRNSASSRAIPNEKLRRRIADDPALPVWWGKNQAGMQAREELAGDELAAVRQNWLAARDMMLGESERLSVIGLHKQLCNRLIEPWMFITVLVTATEYDNWFHLRDHADAQPEIASIATEMHRQYLASTPQRLRVGSWHLPLVEEEDYQPALELVHASWPELGRALDVELERTNILKKISTGRCARVTLLTHDGKRDLKEDIALHDKLCSGPTQDPPQPGHWSPFEHVAQAMSVDAWNLLAVDELGRAIAGERFFDQTIFGNVIGWKQYRKEFEKEHYRGAR